MNVLFYAPEYRPNLSNMIRTAEFYGLKKVYIYDTNQLLSPPSSKVSRADMQHMARVWTAGALDHISIEVVEDINEFLSQYKCRKIATIVSVNAIPIQKFKFEDNDLIIMGSEKKGIPSNIESQCTCSVYIPQLGQTNSLNVSVAFGIFINKALERV
jgi:tRNA G18 (ribose-2'-O)-methylase SpoU